MFGIDFDFCEISSKSLYKFEVKQNDKDRFKKLMNYQMKLSKDEFESITK